jgi:predicted nucleic acid-binding protein
MPGEQFLALFADLVRDSRASGNLVFDAQIAAVCREHGVRRLVTEDRDFRRFSGFATEGLDGSTSR